MNLLDLVISTDFRQLTEDVPKSCQTRSPLGFSHRGEKPQVLKHTGMQFHEIPKHMEDDGTCNRRIWKTTPMISC